MLKKHMLAAMLAAVLLMGGYGCMEMKKNSGYSEYRDVNDGALEYMEQRYGEKFTYIKAHGSFMSYTDRGIMVSCESFPGKEIYVSIVKDGDEEKYYDNYMEYYFAGQVEDYIVDIAKNYFDDVSFEMSISTFRASSKLNLMTTFEEYMDSRNYFVSGHMDVGETTEETMHEFAAELVRRKMYFSIGIDIPSINEAYSIYYYNENDEIEFYRRK
ncbi:MAG: hypothetical protein FWH48_01950 [Oscillospiraceae bacterium]|nr:hypothetical protein [Oscillospiraceae bacterium]